MNMTNTHIEKARAKVIKAAQPASDAHRILITEQGGDQNLHAAVEDLLKIAARLGVNVITPDTDLAVGGTD